MALGLGTVSQVGKKGKVKSALSEKTKGLRRPRGDGEPYSGCLIRRYFLGEKLRLWQKSKCNV